jgi:hypothetical protein
MREAVFHAAFSDGLFRNRCVMIASNSLTSATPRWAASAQAGGAAGLLRQAAGLALRRVFEGVDEIIHRLVEVRGDAASDKRRLDRCYDPLNEKGEGRLVSPFPS